MCREQEELAGELAVKAGVIPFLAASVIMSCVRPSSIRVAFPTEP